MKVLKMKLEDITIKLDKVYKSNINGERFIVTHINVPFSCTGYVESAFGILSNKWKIFHKPINANLDLCILLVKTCVLHNFVRSRDGFNIQETM